MGQGTSKLCDGTWPVLLSYATVLNLSRSRTEIEAQSLRVLVSVLAFVFMHGVGLFLPIQL